MNLVKNSRTTQNTYRQNLDVLAGVGLLSLNEFELFLAHVHNLLVAGEVVLAHRAGFLPVAAATTASESTATSWAAPEGEGTAAAATSPVSTLLITVGALVCIVGSFLVVILTVSLSVLEAATAATSPPEGASLEGHTAEIASTFAATSATAATTPEGSALKVLVLASVVVVVPPLALWLPGWLIASVSSISVSSLFLLLHICV